MRGSGRSILVFPGQLQTNNRSNIYRLLLLYFTPILHTPTRSIYYFMYLQVTVTPYHISITILLNRNVNYREVNFIGVLS